jgi:hypothetical protein
MDRKDILTKALIAFLILVFIGGIVFGAMEVLSTKGSIPRRNRTSKAFLPARKARRIFLRI